jgi:hypothetical protein
VKHSITNAMLRYVRKGRIVAREFRRGIRVWEMRRDG